MRIPTIDCVTGQGGEYFEQLNHRSQLDMREERDRVREIIEAVRGRGDEALLEYEARFDRVDLTAGTLEVTEEEIQAAYRQVGDHWLACLRQAIASIRDFHERQKKQSWMHAEPGKVVGSRVTPMKRVGVYAPGGRALYPSTVLMDVLPAKVAGVREIILCTPPQPDGQAPAVTLVAAREVGVDRIFKAGGAQAVAAMALGTDTIPRVDKIVGPGNIYVTLAKRELYGYVGIDMVAGPSEVLVVADESATPRYVAADLLSQAEHDPLAAAILVTPSAALLTAVREELEKQCAALPKREIAEHSLSHFGALIRVADLAQALEIANTIAPEHLELSVAEPFAWLGAVENAGAVFLGHYAPEPLGDYYAGPNHVLPTSGTARFFSPLSVDDFVKRSSVIFYSREELEKVYQTVAALADSEELAAHARSVRIRFEEQ